LIKGSLLALRESRVWSCRRPFRSREWRPQARCCACPYHTGALSCADNPRGLRTNPLSRVVGTLDPELRLHRQPLATARTVCSQSSRPFRRDAIERSVHRVRGQVLEQTTARMSNASSHRLVRSPRSATKSSTLRKPSVKHDVPVDRRRNRPRTKEVVVIRHPSGKLNKVPFA
jgi:hypothetical protein